MRLRTVVGRARPGVVPGDRLVLLAHLAVPEHRLVRAARPGTDHEHHQAGGHPVEPVRGHQLRQIEFPRQPHQRRLGDVLAARDRGEKVRFVHNEEIVVAVHHLDVERHRRLHGKVPVKPDHPVRHERRVRAQRAVGVHDPPLPQHLVDPLRIHPRQPAHQVLAQRPPRALRRHPHPHRIEAEALRQRALRTASTSHQQPTAAMIKGRILSFNDRKGPFQTLRCGRARRRTSKLSAAAGPREPRGPPASGHG